MVAFGIKHILRITCFHYVPSGTFTGAGFNLSYRVLHPSGIVLVSEFGTGESGKMELTGTSDLFLWELNLQPKKAERLQKSP